MSDHSMFGNIWMHLLILIPVEFGILHATPLGGMLVGLFNDMFAGLGFEFAKAAAHTATEVGAEAVSSCGIEGCSLHSMFTPEAAATAVESSTQTAEAVVESATQDTVAAPKVEPESMDL